VLAAIGYLIPIGDDLRLLAYNAFSLVSTLAIIVLDIFYMFYFRRFLTTVSATLHGQRNVESELSIICKHGAVSNIFSLLGFLVFAIQVVTGSSLFLAIQFIVLDGICITIFTMKIKIDDFQERKMLPKTARLGASSKLMQSAQKLDPKAADSTKSSNRVRDSEKAMSSIEKLNK
jgi:hypothetical protein